MTLALVLGAVLAAACVVLVALPYLRDPAPADDVLEAPDELERRRLELARLFEHVPFGLRFAEVRQRDDENARGGEDGAENEGKAHVRAGASARGSSARSASAASRRSGPTRAL